MQDTEDFQVNWGKSRHIIDTGTECDPLETFTRDILCMSRLAIDAYVLYLRGSILETRIPLGSLPFTNCFSMRRFLPGRLVSVHELALYC